MKRRHSMPFGADCREDGSVRFRLWAPAAHQVALCLGGANKPMWLPLTRIESGWFELTSGEAKPGSEYSFRIDHSQEVPDPPCRLQTREVHRPSEGIHPHAVEWQ